MIIRVPLAGQGTVNSPLRVDLPTYQTIATDETVGRALVDVPDVDVPADVAAFVAANPTPDLIAPLPSSFPVSLAGAWREHLARRYDLGQARWNPVVA